MAQEKPTLGLFPSISSVLLAAFESALRAEQERVSAWKEDEKPNSEAAYWQSLTHRAISENKAVKESYLRLLRAGVRSPEALQMFVGMAVSVPLKRDRKRAEWLLGSGKSAKTLRYFLKRLADMADEIERLNQHPLLRPDICVRGRNVSESEKKYFGLWFTRLPFLLRYYAAFLGGHFKSMSGRIRQTSRTKAQPEILSALIHLVRKQTGRPMYNELSEILTAADGMAGGNRTFDPASLKVLASRKRAKRIRALATQKPHDLAG